MEQQTPKGRLHRLNTITPLSKYLAMGVCILLPFIGGLVGYQYGLHEQKTQVPDVVVPVAPTPATVVERVMTITDSTDFYEISVVYPEDPRDQNRVVETFVKNLVAEKQAAWRTGGEMYLVEQELTAELPDRPKVTYALDIRYSSTSNTLLETTSYVLMVSEATGGANSNVAIVTYTFGPAGLVEIEDVLTLSDGTNAIALSRLLARTAVIQTPEAFQAVDQLEEGLGIAFLKEDGVTFDPIACQCDGFFFGSNFQNFSLTDTGITFTFSKYAIAPGAVMTPEIRLTWEQLGDYLTNKTSEMLGLEATVIDTTVYQSVDGQIRLELFTENRFRYTEQGLRSEGTYNPERGWGNDSDATVYVLNWQQPEEEQIVLVRLTTEPEKLFRLTASRELATTIASLQKLQ